MKMHPQASIDDFPPTKGQLEQTLSQEIQALYQDELGHRLSNVECQIVDHRIAIVIENALTQIEQVLVDSGKQELAKQVRLNLNAAIKSQLTETIEETVGVPVVDLLNDTTIATQRMGIIAVLSGLPKLRRSAIAVSTAKD